MSATDERYRSRYASESPVTDEARSATWAEVNAVWERLMPTRRGESMGAMGGFLAGPSGEVNCDGPGMKEAWRRRSEKARREIAEHREHIEIMERLARMMEDESDTESTEVIEATERDDFAAERSQFERLTKRFLLLMKAAQ